jgi:hypothetical protein
VPRLGSSTAAQVAQLQAALHSSAAESERLAEELQQVSQQLATEEARKRDMARKLKEAHTGLRATQRDMQRLVDQVGGAESGLGWAGLGWAGLGWAGLGWAGLGWAGLGWAGWAGCIPLLAVLMWHMLCGNRRPGPFWAPGLTP